MNSENTKKIRPEKWVLTPDDEELIIQTALFRKIKRLEWQNKGSYMGSDESKVVLSDDEKESALIQGNATKEAKMTFASIEADNRQREALKEDAVKAEWGYSRFFSMMKSEAIERGEKLIFNDTTSPLIKAICFRLSNDPRYQTEFKNIDSTPFSFSRGLIIRGNPGLGKSWLISLVAENPVCPVQIITMNEITEMVRNTGEFTGTKFASHSIVYIDDVGTEDTPVKYFGTEINWFKDWIEGIYAKKKAAFSKVIFSTNIDFDEIGAKYGFRVRDRLAETFDVLFLKGKSMRKK